MREDATRVSEGCRTPLTPSPPLLSFFILEMPTGGKKLVLGTKGNSKTIVDWVNGQSKLDTKETSTASVQNLLRDWQGCEVDPRQWRKKMGHTDVEIRREGVTGSSWRVDLSARKT